MIKVLERSVTLGQAPERKAEVVALCLFVCLFFCRATHRKPSVLILCLAEEWVTVSSDLSVAARCHDNHKEKQNIFFCLKYDLYLFPYSSIQS